MTDLYTMTDLYRTSLVIDEVDTNTPVGLMASVRLSLRTIEQDESKLDLTLPISTDTTAYRLLIKLVEDNKLSEGQLYLVSAAALFNDSRFRAEVIRTLLINLNNLKKQIDERLAEQKADDVKALDMDSKPIPRFQFRGIGESDWADCTEQWYSYCSKSPLHEARIVE